MNQSHARILYVDDDRALRRLGEELLACMGYEVETADDGAEAWLALQNRNYHLLITDNQMPHLTGLELIHKMCEARMTVPIILASGALAALPPEELSWLESGALLAKPFTAEQLISTAEDVLSADFSARGTQGRPGASVAAMAAMTGIRVRIESRPHWGINE